MVTITVKGQVSQDLIDKEKAIHSEGSVAFENVNEAREWAENHFKHGEYDILELCPHCDEGTYVKENKLKYPSMYKIIKPVKIVNLL